MTNLKLFATSVVCAMGMALTACGGGLSVAVPGAVQSPSITSQPVNQSVIAGQSATFSVAATGSATLSFQWKKYGSNIPGATSSSYTTPATSPADSGAVFTVVVSNSAGTAISTHATLTVTANAVPPTVTTQPQNLSVLPGASASFWVSATGTSPLTYQWKKNGTDIPGATTSSYSTPPASNADNGAAFSVKVSNSAGTVTSGEASLIVTAAAVAPAITTQPENQSVTAGQSASFSVSASGTFPFSYQWKKNGIDILGATASTYTTPATALGDTNTVYSVVVTNSAGSVTSNAASLAVTAAAVAPAITTQPAAQTVTEGQTATFSVTATGTAFLGYQWKKDGVDISGATSSTYTTPATSSADSNAVFSVVVTNSVSTVTSSSARLTVAAAALAPVITVQPTAQTITSGATATFSVTATGTGTLSYQWKKNGTNITGGTGATTNTYTTPVMGYAGNGAEYSVEVSNGAGSVTSSSATLTVNKSTATGYSEVPNPSGGNYAKTECVKDNSTGLIWEGKTASPATSRLGTSTYTNYDSTTSAQKWNGTNPAQAEIDASTNSIGYKNSVNASALCGYTDWRLPTKEELQGIVLSDASHPSIDTAWFRNTQVEGYWTSSPYVGDSVYAWGIGFSYGYVYKVNRGVSNYVRLVR